MIYCDCILHLLTVSTGFSGWQMLFQKSLLQRLKTNHCVMETKQRIILSNILPLLFLPLLLLLLLFFSLEYFAGWLFIITYPLPNLEDSVFVMTGIIKVSIGKCCHPRPSAAADIYIYIHSTHYLFSYWPKAYREFSKSAPGTSSSCRLYINHVKDTKGHE